MSQLFSLSYPERPQTGSWLVHLKPFALTLGLAMTLTACGGGGGGGNSDGGSGETPDPVVGDDARRAVLQDIAEEIILPSLRDFDVKALALKTAADTLASAPGDAGARTSAQTAWQAAMTSWQRNEVLQVGPAGRSTNPDMVAAGQDFRSAIYSWPLTLDSCELELAADNGDAVDGSTELNITGLGALEHLLFTDVAPDACAAQPTATERALHVQKLAARLALLATSLRNRWEPAFGNFINQWNTAGLTSEIYMSPQHALNALSIALFYVEKMGKDRKIAYPTGIPAAQLSCTNPASCPEHLESRTARHSGANLATNVQAFRDVFTGLNGQLGMNDLLEGIGRPELATEIVAELDAVLAQLATIESSSDFDTTVEGITDRNECLNAFASSSGLAPCALAGILKTAMDTFRGPIIGSLSLAIPDSAAGDND